MGYVSKGEDFLPGISLKELDELFSGTEKRESEDAFVMCHTSEKRKDH